MATAPALTPGAGLGTAARVTWAGPVQGAQACPRFPVLLLCCPGQTVEVEPARISALQGHLTQLLLAQTRRPCLSALSGTYFCKI